MSCAIRSFLLKEKKQTARCTVCFKSNLQLAAFKGPIALRRRIPPVVLIFIFQVSNDIHKVYVVCCCQIVLYSKIRIIVTQNSGSENAQSGQEQAVPFDGLCSPASLACRRIHRCFLNCIKPVKQFRHGHTFQPVKKRFLFLEYIGSVMRRIPIGNGKRTLDPVQLLLEKGFIPICDKLAEEAAFQCFC